MSLVLITGVNGFVASNVVLQFLKAGYKVRGTLRGGKIDVVRKAIGDKFPDLELVQVDDVGTSDLTDALKGVDAVVHVSSPLPFGLDPEENLKNAIEGYLNVLRQAVKNGISKVVITGSWAATVDPTLKQAFEGLVSTEKDWGNVTKEEFLSGKHDIIWSYLAAKTLAERAAWDFAEKNPSLDLAILNPPFIFGPFVPGLGTPAPGALSSNQHVYTLISGTVPPPLPPVYVDVRDVGRAHVAALRVPRATGNVQDKRFLISGGTMIWKDAVEYLRETRKDLESRLPPLDAAFPSFPGPVTTIDTARAKKDLGMDEYIDWKKTLEDAIDGLLEAEKGWAAPVAV